MEPFRLGIGMRCSQSKTRWTLWFLYFIIALVQNASPSAFGALVILCVANRLGFVHLCFEKCWVRRPSLQHSGIRPWFYTTSNLIHPPKTIHHKTLFSNKTTVLDLARVQTFHSLPRNCYHTENKATRKDAMSPRCVASRSMKTSSIFANTICKENDDNCRKKKRGKSNEARMPCSSVSNCRNAARTFWWALLLTALFGCLGTASAQTEPEFVTVNSRQVSRNSILRARLLSFPFIF